MNVYNADGVLIGRLEGTFVVSLSGKRIYRIDEGEVYCRKEWDEGDSIQPLRLPEVMIGNFEGGVALDSCGMPLFTVDSHAKGGE